jgi:hypothetical protein
VKKSVLVRSRSLYVANRIRERLEEQIPGVSFEVEWNRKEATVSVVYSEDVFLSLETIKSIAASIQKEEEQ